MALPPLPRSILAESPSLWIAEGRFLADMAAHQGPLPERIFLGCGTREYSATRDHCRPEIDALLLHYASEAARILDEKGCRPGQVRRQPRVPRACTACRAAPRAARAAPVAAIAAQTASWMTVVLWLQGQFVGGSAISLRDRAASRAGDPQTCTARATQGRLRFHVEPEAGHHEGAWQWRFSGAMKYLFSHLWGMVPL